MHRFVRNFIALLPPILALLVLSGCWKVDSLLAQLDRASFHYVGGTMFGNPDLLTMKEVHLDNGALAGREIILEGRLSEVSEHRTYLVLQDDAARLLVVLTDLDPSVVESIIEQPTSLLRVMGTIESGKKGLPYLMATAVSTAALPGKA